MVRKVVTDERCNDSGYASNKTIRQQMQNVSPEPRWHAIVVAVVCSSAAASIITQQVIGRREKRTRRGEFREFLCRWKNGIESESDTARTYSEGRILVQGYKGRLLRDFWWQSAFASRCDAATSFNVEDVRADPEGYRKKISQKLDALIHFV